MLRRQLAALQLIYCTKKVRQNKKWEGWDEPAAHMCSRVGLTTLGSQLPIDRRIENRLFISNSSSIQNCKTCHLPFTMTGLVVTTAASPPPTPRFPVRLFFCGFFKLFPRLTVHPFPSLSPPPEGGSVCAPTFAPLRPTAREKTNHQRALHPVVHVQ